MIAACLQNKVYLELYKGSPLYPNLYTFLIGPSGIGKGRAISCVMSFLETCGVTEEIGVKGGSITSAALIDFLSSKKGSLPNGTSRAFLVHPELSSSIKWGEHSDAFVKRMTDLFTGDLGTYEDSTRTSGAKSAGKPCMNWLGASTRRWLVTNIKADAMAGGFMARGLFPEVMNMPNTRQFLPIYPDDYPQVFDTLQQRLVNEILTLTGEFKMDTEALDYLEDWYMTRPRPRTEEGLASWQRHRELALKIAMALSAGTDSSKIINLGHLYQAVALVEEIKSGERDLWDFVIAGGKVIDLDFVSQKIAIAGEITHIDLLRATSSRGIHSRKLWELLDILEQQNRMVTKVIPANPALRKRKVIYYTWKSEKPTLAHSRQEDLWE
jgi:hypothetical protein